MTVNLRGFLAWALFFVTEQRQMWPSSFRQAVARTARLFILLAPLSVLVGGCGDSDGNGSGGDGSPDQLADEAGGPADLDRPDGSGGDAAGNPRLDAAPLDGALPDQMEGEGGLGDGGMAQNGTCAAATPLVFVDDQAAVSGDTGQLADEHQTLKCKGTGDTSETTMSGPQAYYSFAVVAGQWYKITLDPTFSAYAYVFTGDCSEAKIQADCQSGGETGQTSTFISAGVPESFYFLAASDGLARVAVDSSSSTNAGPFSLTVERIPAPVNGTCAAAPLLGFAAGKAQATGDIGPTLTPDEFASLSCGSGKPFDGPQAYYRFASTSGKAYRVTLTADTAMFLHAYVFGSDCSPAAIEADCKSAGATGDVLGKSVSGGASESFLFMPEAAGIYTVAVDTRSPTSFGGFTLAIEELTPASNAACVAATPVPLGPNASATITGSTVTATNEHGTEINCGGLTAYDGPQVYYALEVKAAKGYRVTLKPQFRATLYAFVEAACSVGPATINAACGGVATGGSWGPIPAGGEGVLFLHPDVPGTYLLAVDSASNTEVGTFELSVTEVDLPSHTTCSSAAPLALDASGAVTIEDSTGFSSDQYAGLQCGPGATSLNGPQLYYQLAVKATRFYELSLTSTFFDAYLYLFGSGVCSQQALTVDCASDGASGDVLGPVSVSSDVLYYTPSSDGLIKLAVDSAISPLSDEYGDFALEVREREPASNGSCAGAMTAKLVDQAVSVEGFTVRLVDEFPGQIACGGGEAFAAGQVYYKVDLVGGVDYLVKLATDFDAELYAFVAAPGGGCPGPAAIEAACGPAGVGAHLTVPAKSRGALVLRPTASARYYLVVDGTSTRDVGGFSLAVAPVPLNQRCAAPAAITLATSPTTTTGDTSLGVSNEFGNGVSCGNLGGPWPGPQLYYRATLQASTAYTVRVRQDGWDPALYAFPAATACAATDIDLACESLTPVDPDNLFNSDSLGVGDETITVKPTATADWIFVVDSFSATGASGGGSFNLDISW